jgi:CRISPR/Cas system-associated protein Cas10 (large subunit of type III CRISPR-Cas system)
MLVKNVPEPREDYEKSTCKHCEQEVWITPLARDMMKLAPQMEFCCTECALIRR